jgi:hypothetical protein
VSEIFEQGKLGEATKAGLDLQAVKPVAEGDAAVIFEVQNHIGGRHRRSSVV